MIRTLLIGTLLVLLAGCGGIPIKAESNYKKAQKTYSTQDYKQSIVLLEKALKEYPRYKKARILLAECYRLSKQYGKARKNFEIVLKTDPVNKISILGMAYSFRKDGKFHESIGYYQSLFQVAIDSEVPLSVSERFAGRFGMAQCYLGLEKPESALRELDTCSKIKNSPEVYYYKAIAKERDGGQFDLAIEQYKKALEVDSTFALAHRALGYLYFEYYRDDKNWKAKSLSHYKKYLALTQVKDENLIAHLNVLEGKVKPKIVNKDPITLAKNKPLIKRCPLCSRTYKGKTTICFFDATPLKTVEP